MSDPSVIVERAFAAFHSDRVGAPSITLRGGDALDDYATPPAFDSALDVISDEYLRKFKWGITYLDLASWRYYLPHLIEHAVRCHHESSDVTDALLENLRPPDRGRFESMTAQQESVVVQFLDLLAFSESSPHAELARTALEEWWAPGALYRSASTVPRA